MTEPNPGAATPESDRVVIKITAQTLRHWLQIARRILGWLTLAYVGGLFVILIALEWGGEKLWLLSLLLFAPPQVMLLPLLILTPLCMVFRPRLCLWHLGIVLILAFGYMNFRWSGTPVRTERTLTAVTFNAGQSSHSQFTQFIEHEKPDVVLMQDAGTTLANSLQKKLPGYHVARYGEYSLVSRFPIQKAALLPAPLGEGRPVCARFEVLVHAQPVAFYGVHMPTPRRVLSHFMGGRRILGEIAGVSRRDPLYGSYGEWLDQRIQLARDLRQVFADEKLPFIVGGDFNMADHGHIYHLFAGEMTDAFKASGRGWGMTFPGSTRNPVAGFGPWLRLDYFFAGRGWRAVECRPEPGRKSQHKAVLGRFEPLPPK